MPHPTPRYTLPLLLVVVSVSAAVGWRCLQHPQRCPWVRRRGTRDKPCLGEHGDRALAARGPWAAELMSIKPEYDLKRVLHTFSFQSIYRWKMLFESESTFSLKPKQQHSWLENTAFFHKISPYLVITDCDSCVYLIFAERMLTCNGLPTHLSS